MKPVIIDCDPGVDDAVAILLANKLPEFNILAITTVAGNVSLERTTYNALGLAEFIGLDVPVYRGAAGPMFRERVDAAEVHGNDGMAGIDLAHSRKEVEGVIAWDAIYQHAVAWKGELELIAIGPLTNLGMAFIKYPDLPKLLKRIVIMGGSTNEGNASPAAEFNIYADPEAADIVFCAGVPVHMCGLDMTMKALMTPEDIERVAALGSKEAKFFRDVVQGIIAFMKKLGVDGINMHDPAAMLYAADGSIFKAYPAGIRVETRGSITLGKTVTDLYSDAKWPKNGFAVMDVDCEAFMARVMELMKQYQVLAG
ncbi:MAG TPA: nucleoside hydrolase [Anaerolineaceae bacterium]|nr:nucleoside hydrolase [Chloroflexota bacterium]HNY83801.1 nucleoside hydrolase [Anaerolineaceae bacterium]